MSSRTLTLRRDFFRFTLYLTWYYGLLRYYNNCIKQLFKDIPIVANVLKKGELANPTFNF